MEANSLLNAMIAWYIDQITPYRDSHEAARGVGHWEMLCHAAQVARGLTESEAVEWLSEELQDRFAATAD